MKDNKNADEYVEQALNSIEGISRATPKPYLLTRIHARLESQTKNWWETAAYFISRPAVVAGSLFLLIAMNVAVVLVNNATTDNSVSDRQTTDEYTSAFATIDNIENPDSQ